VSWNDDNGQQRDEQRELNNSDMKLFMDSLPQTDRTTLRKFNPAAKYDWGMTPQYV